MRRFGLTLLLCGLLAACGGGTTGGGNNNGGGGGGGGGGNNPPTAALGGVALAADGDLVRSQAPLGAATVEVFGLPQAAALATGSADGFGSYQLTGVPLNRSLRVVARTATRIVSAIFNSPGTTLTRHCGDVTHVAALAMLATGETSFTDAQILIFEQAARARLEAALLSDPGARFNLLANQAAADAVAAQVGADVAAGGSLNLLPQVGNIVTTPTQFVVQGGIVEITLAATDSELLNVVALVLRPGAAAPEAVVLGGAGGNFSGSLAVADNNTGAVQRTGVYIIVDDGLHAPVPETLRTIQVRPDGTFVLDILTETLFDEPASRAKLDAQLDRLRPVYHRGDGRARRQVNPNQTIRGATVAVVDNPGLIGTTDNDGLLLLQVPLSLLTDRLIGIDASIAGRVGYRQFLILPPDLAPLEGDRIEVDLVLATQAQWQSVATESGLGSLNFGIAPLLAFFNVRNDVTLTGGAPGAQSFRPIVSTLRADDGDFLYSNLPTGPLGVQGTFTDPVDTVAAEPFGPVDLALAAAKVHAVAALLPPE